MIPRPLEKIAYDSRDDTIENHGDNCSLKYEALLVCNTQNGTDGNDVIDAHHITHGSTHRLHTKDNRKLQAKFTGDGLLDAAKRQIGDGR